MLETRMETLKLVSTRQNPVRSWPQLEELRSVGFARQAALPSLVCDSTWSCEPYGSSVEGPEAWRRRHLWSAFATAGVPWRHR